MIPYGRQNIEESDIEAVVNVLRSDWITQGPVIGQFEGAVAAYCGAKFGIAVNSATSALYSACAALGLGSGDRLWTSPNTFVASANCALYCGALVDFVDIDPSTLNMSIPALEVRLLEAEAAGTLPKIVVPVHFAGQSCDMQAVRALADKYGFYVIEDASHAIGARYQDEPVGSCRYSDITVFSFHPVKIITTAEGGMSLTNDPDLAGRLRRFRNHGLTREPEMMRHSPDGPWSYQQIELGYNYRMTDMQAALGLSQLSRLDDFVHQRHQLADRYDEFLSRLPITIPWRHPDCYSAFHLYPIRIKSALASQGRREIFEYMQAGGIGVNVHYIPVHTQPYYQDIGFRQGDFPEAERYYLEALSLPLFPGLGTEEQDMVVDALTKAIK